MLKHCDQLLHALLGLLGHLVRLQELALTCIEVMLDEEGVLVDDLVVVGAFDNCHGFLGVDAQVMPGSDINAL